MHLVTPFWHKTLLARKTTQGQHFHIGKAFMYMSRPPVGHHACSESSYWWSLLWRVLFVICVQHIMEPMLLTMITNSGLVKVSDI